MIDEELNTKIIEYLKTTTMPEQQTIMQIMSAVGVSRPTVAKALGVLMGQQRITEHEVGTAKLYRLVEA